MSNQNIIIKCATNEDIEDICRFEKEARITEPEIWGWEFNEDDYTKKLNLINLEKLNTSKIVIAKQNNIIVGRCDIGIILSLLECEKTGFIDWIYTLKNYRGIGIGKELLKGAEIHFKSQGVNSYYLFTASNEQSKQFYHRQNNFVFSTKEVAKKEI